MSDEIRTSEGRVVGSWDGKSAEELKRELARILQVLKSEGKGEELQRLSPVGMRQERLMFGRGRCEQDRVGGKGTFVLVSRAPLTLFLQVS